MKKREIATGFVILLLGLLLAGVMVRLLVVVVLQYLFLIRL
jgi:hypothetical protein